MRTFKAATLAVISGSNPKRPLQFDLLHDFPPENFVAGFHVRQVEIGGHVGKGGQKVVATECQ